MPSMGELLSRRARKSDGFLVRRTDESADEEDKAEAEKYETFWKEFGRALKLGIIEDAANRPRLAKLLRVRTSADPEKLISLDTYVARMKDDQKEIFYLTGAPSGASHCNIFG